MILKFPLQAFASVNIADSKATQELAVTTMVDSAAMKQVRLILFRLAYHVLKHTRLRILR